MHRRRGRAASRLVAQRAQSSAAPTAMPTATLVRELPAALLIGVLSALSLLALTWVADALQDLLWTRLPKALDIGSSGHHLAWWWPVVVLTVTGILVGITVRVAPGHAGPDPATTGMMAPPLPIMTLPGVGVTLVLGLAGGVSLGPENPIIAVNVGLALWLVMGRTRSREWTSADVAPLAIAGTIGALFATPVAAALLLTETVAERSTRPGPLFDRIFGPLVAAGAGSMTMSVVGAPTFAVPVGPYADPKAWDIVSAPVVALAAALLVAAGAVVLPLAHRAFHGLHDPVLILGAGGIALGLLGAVGGQVTLFKGLDEMKELAATADDRTWVGLLGIALVKVGAVVVATASGFRGGRIFPAVFVGVAVGLAASALVPGIPSAVGVAAGVLGAVIAVDRDGWIALFMAAITVGDVRLLPLLCLTVAPLWLVARSLPEFLVPSPPASDAGEQP